MFIRGSNLMGRIRGSVLVRGKSLHPRRRCIKKGLRSILTAIGYTDIIIVGHNIASKCDFANALLGYSCDIKHFQCRKLIVKQRVSRELITGTLRVALAPNLDTPAWDKTRKRIKDVYHNRIFVYVKSVDGFKTDDVRSIENIREFFGKKTNIILVISHNEANDEAVKKTCAELVTTVESNCICLQSSLHKTQKAEIAKQVLHLATAMLIFNERNIPHSLQSFRKYDWFDYNKRKLNQRNVKPTEKGHIGDKLQDPPRHFDAGTQRYADGEARRKSFDTWTNSLSPSLLAEAGFYYTGEDDICICFSCKGIVRKWSSQHEPWMEHVRWFPGCAYVIETLGDVIVRDLLIDLDNNLKAKTASDSGNIDISKRPDDAINTKSVRLRTPDSVKIELRDEHWELYWQTLNGTTIPLFHTRVNLVGHQGVGKTTLLKRLLNVDIECPSSTVAPTEGLDIDRTASRTLEIHDGKRHWETDTAGYDEEMNCDRMAQAMLKCSVSKIHDDSKQGMVLTITEQTDKAKFQEEEREIKTEREIGRKRTDRYSWITEEYDISELEFGSEEVEEQDLPPANLSYTRFEYKVTSEKRQYLEKVIKKMQYSPGERIYLTYWDFAGQTPYYTTHQAFMTPAAVYLLVVDLSMPLNVKMKENLLFRSENLEETTVLDTIRFWAGSIRAYTADKAGKNAPCIVVGTHKDKVDAKTIDSIFKEITGTLKMDEVSCIPIDNTLEAAGDTDLKELKNRIIDSDLGIIGTEIPAQWLGLEFSLLKLKRTGQILLTFRELKDLDAATDLPMNDDARLVNFLEHEHCKGHLMFFPDDYLLKHIIVLEPKILVDFINLLMRKKPNKSTQLNLRVKNYGWCSDGLFDREFIDSAIENEAKEIKQYIDTILDIFIHLKIVYHRETSRKNQMFFFMPCLLGVKPPDHYAVSAGKSTTSPLIRLSFEEQMIPPAFFHSLITTLLGRWVPQKENGITRIYNRYACFCLEGETVLLELYWMESCIYVQIINFSKQKELKSLRCEVYLDSIESDIDTILRTYKQDNIEWSFSQSCPDHMIPASYISIKSLRKTGEALCTPQSNSSHQHAVTADETLGKWFSESFFTTLADRIQRSRRLNKEPTDKELARLALVLHLEDANTLAKLIKMQRSYKVAELAIKMSRDNGPLALLFILRHWRQQARGNATMGKLLDCITSCGNYDSEDLEDEIFKDIPRGRYENVTRETLDKTPTDRQCGVISEYISDNISMSFLFIELGLEPKYLEKTVRNKSNLDANILALLIEWRNIYSEKATIQTFLDTAQIFDIDVKAIVQCLFREK